MKIALYFACMKTNKPLSAMRYFLAFFLALSSLGAFAQNASLFTPPLKDGNVFYEKVVTVDGKSKDDIYSRAEDWYLKTFKSGEEDIITQDNANGQFSAKAGYPFSVHVSGDNDYIATFNFQIDCKDGKYRCRFTDFKRTDKGATASSENAEYLINVPMENDIAIENGGVKGFSRASQKQAATARLTALDNRVNYLIEDLNKYITKKAEDF